MKNVFQSLLTGLAFCLAGFNLSAAAAPVDWNVITTDTGAAVADCRDCDENISVLVVCDRGAKHRVVDLLLLEQREDALAGKSATVTVTAGKTTLSIAATYSQPGEAGPYPIARLASNDPFFELLSHATSAQLAVNGYATTMGLKGTRKAFTAMQKICP